MKIKDTWYQYTYTILNNLCTDDCQCQSVSADFLLGLSILSCPAWCNCQRDSVRYSGPYFRVKWQLPAVSLSVLFYSPDVFLPLQPKQSHFSSSTLIASAHRGRRKGSKLSLCAELSVSHAHCQFDAQRDALSPLCFRSPPGANSRAALPTYRYQ